MWKVESMKKIVYWTSLGLGDFIGERWAEQTILRMSSHDASLQNYFRDRLPMIVSEDVASGHFIIIDSHSRDLNSRIFKTSRTDRAERSGHLDTSDLTETLQNTSWSLAQVARIILRWAEILRSKPRKIRIFSEEVNRFISKARGWQVYRSSYG